MAIGSKLEELKREDAEKVMSGRPIEKKFTGKTT